MVAQARGLSEVEIGQTVSARRKGAIRCSRLRFVAVCNNGKAAWRSTLQVGVCRCDASSAIASQLFSRQIVHTIVTMNAARNSTRTLVLNASRSAQRYAGAFKLHLR